MNINDLTFGEMKQIAAIVAGAAPAPKPSFRIECDNRAVIVRAHDAGVHYGHLTAFEGRTVWLSGARRLWSWTAISGVALSGVAANGVNASKSKIDSYVENIVILDACEIIDCAPEAAKTIEAA